MRNWKNKISNNISYTEATKSRTATKFNIINIPNKETVERMKYVANEIFEPLREHFGVPIAITSFYRSKKLNKSLGGSSTSEHVYGSAIDLDADVMGMVTNKQLFNWIKNNCEFNQLIWEFGTDKEPAWIHVSCKKTGNKNQIVKAYKSKNWAGNLVTKYKKLN
jgi:hypothetical protein